MFQFAQWLAAPSPTEVEHEVASHIQRQPQFTGSLWGPPRVSAEQATHDPDLIDDEDSKAEAHKAGGDPEVSVHPGGMVRGIGKREDEGDGD